MDAAEVLEDLTAARINKEVMRTIIYRHFIDNVCVTFSPHRIPNHQAEQASFLI